MNVAEELFGEKGIDAVSMRTISELSKTKNKSAAQYYFNDKHNLVLETMRHRRLEIDALRRKLAGKSAVNLNALTTRELIRLIAIPMMNFKAPDGRRRYVAFLKEILFYDPFHKMWMDHASVGPFTSAVLDTLQQKHAHINPELWDFRLKIAVRFLVTSIVDFDRNRIDPPLSEELFVQEIVRIAQATLDG